jgi:hypothetical protein
LVLVRKLQLVLIEGGSNHTFLVWQQQAATVPQGSIGNKGCAAVRHVRRPQAVGYTAACSAGACWVADVVCWTCRTLQQRVAGALLQLLRHAGQQQRLHYSVCVWHQQLVVM